MACDNDRRLLATQKANDTAALVEELNVKVAAQAAQLQSERSDHVTARAQAEEVSRERDRLLRDSLNAQEEVRNADEKTRAAELAERNADEKTRAAEYEVTTRAAELQSALEQLQRMGIAEALTLTSTLERAGDLET